MNLILAFLVGLIATNGVPHFVQGIIGNPHDVPWRKPASAPVNVLWGTINFALAWTIAGFVRFDWITGYVAIAGAFLTAIQLAKHWSKPSQGPSSDVDSGKGTEP